MAESMSGRMPENIVKTYVSSNAKQNASKNIKTYVS